MHVHCFDVATEVEKRYVKAEHLDCTTVGP